MPDLEITSGEVGRTARIKTYRLQDGGILVTGTKDAGATVKVSLDPGGEPQIAQENQEDPKKWSAKLAATRGARYTIQASSDSPLVKEATESIEVVA
jgi:hypothetical protein